MKLIPVVLLILLCLPGCTRYIRWIKCTFTQADMYKDALCKARSFIRSTAIYDQLNTVALFDVLWLSKTVQDAYIDLYAFHWNLSENKIKELKKDMREHLNATISFYVLLAPNDDDNILSENDLDAQWTVTLLVNNKTYYPREIRLEDDLLPEYKAIFGNLVSIHKSIYYVIFDGIENNEPLIKNTTSSIMLSFHSPLYGTQLCWKAL